MSSRFAVYPRKDFPVVARRNIPLYFGLYQKLKRSIFSGEIPKGTKIGSIEELAKEYEVSQASVRKALELLAEEGLIIKKQGWGTIVPDNVDLTFIDLNQIVQLKELTDLTARTKTDFLFVGWVEPTPRLTRLFGLEKGSPEKMLYKVHFLATYEEAGTKAIQTLYLEDRLLRELFTELPSPRDIILEVAKRIDTTPLKYRESIRPMVCTAADAELLELPDGTPLFDQRIAFRDMEGRMCFYVEILSTANIFVRETELNVNGLQ